MNKFFINFIPNKTLRHKLRKCLYASNELVIKADTRCLLVAPHPDDEMIGAGGVLCMYPDNFDVVVMGSSGTEYKERTALDHSCMRIKEFNKVMNTLRIKNHWIFQTVGQSGIEQMKAYFKQYLNVLITKDYDYIFLPVPHDRHPDHNYITNNIFKSVLRENGYKENLKIVFYEVWSLIPNPNLFVDISSVIDKKIDVLHLYQSAHVLFQYADIVKGLNRYRGTQANLPMGYAEGFYIDTVCHYLKRNYKVRLNG